MESFFPSIPWKRCQFHLQQNAQAYVPKKDLKIKVAQDIRNIFKAPNYLEAEHFLNISAVHYQKSEPLFSNWILKNVTEGITIFDFPHPH